ncbi:putative Membrane-associated kinase regulator-like protein [Quillaja saponaria]|uniref:Membrane-associated kinase regulator-like protein n=1 Tax=Quillaja saponaria TaxID=32244 RepID=A0AAD7PGN9_QUISA|nr:putative Membrane-associated kinase regulator-like protein [Quillaja saponaria]
MGKQTMKDQKSRTLPSSPSHSFSSSSSSDFEFTISISPRKSSTALCPADELFYKGQLLPLHLSPRISMVRSLLLSSSSTSSSSSTATNTASRDSTGSNDSQSSFNSDLLLFADCDSSRTSSVIEEDEFRRLHNPSSNSHTNRFQFNSQSKQSNKYFSLSRFSSVFRKEPSKTHVPESVSGSSVKRVSATAKEVFKKYLKKVRPLYEKLSQQKQQRMGGFASTLATTSSGSDLVSCMSLKTERSIKETEYPGKTTGRKDNGGGFSHSFSGNLKYPRKRSCVSSCPSSMRSSPSHSGVLSRTGFNGNGRDTSSMEELQSAIQGAISHCKNSMIQSKTMVSNEI